LYCFSAKIEPSPLSFKDLIVKFDSQTKISFYATSQLWSPEPYFTLSLSQIFTASGLSCLGNNLMALFGHFALHKPHPKHLVGSIYTLERADE
jgi:hypothetical protein